MTTGGQTFDVAGFLRELDAIFAAHQGPDAAEDFLLSALLDAQDVGDRSAELTVLNEIVGFYRSISRHDDAIAAADRALALVTAMGVTGTEAHATTLINAATALRAGGHLDAAAARYTEALAVAEKVMAPTDRRLAALHNNLSMLWSDAGDSERAATELQAALRIVEAASVDPDGDVDVAATLTNLALVYFTLGRDAEGDAAIGKARAIFASGDNASNPHAASALAGFAEASFRAGRLTEARDAYAQALAVVAECYGTGSDAYRITADNLADVDAALQSTSQETAQTSEVPAVGEPAQTSEPAQTGEPPQRAHRPAAPAPEASAARAGLELSRAFWQEYGQPMLAAQFPHLQGRVAAGLVGHGSECYGFDDAWSRDHDFGPGFCLWLTAEDFATDGARLQAAYDALPTTFRGVGPRRPTPRARGENRRVGVFEIGEFYTGITGWPAAPPADKPHEWLLLEEATLAAATNGAVFADPLGAFSAVRNGFRRMPRDVWLALVSRRLGMMSQAGQYNLPRMLDRGQPEGAWLAAGEFVRASASLVFLLNKPASAGYLPYYKWQFAALRRLAARPMSRLPQVVDHLTEVQRLASAACFGGAQFGEGGKGASVARQRVEQAIQQVADETVAALRTMGLTSSDETFLEWQRPEVERTIRDPWLRSV